jgi:hypothetical protein
LPTVSDIFDIGASSKPHTVFMKPLFFMSFYGLAGSLSFRNWQISGVLSFIQWTSTVASVAHPRAGPSCRWSKYPKLSSPLSGQVPGKPAAVLHWMKNPDNVINPL